MGITQRTGHHADKKWAKEMGNGPVYFLWPLVIVGFILFAIGVVLNRVFFQPLDWCLKKMSNFI